MKRTSAISTLFFGALLFVLMAFCVYPQVLYADAPVTQYTEKSESSGLTVTLKGVPNASAQVVIWKPGKKGVENREITLDASGQASATFDATTITKDTSLQDAAVAASIKRRRDTSTAGAWPGAW